MKDLNDVAVPSLLVDPLVPNNGWNWTWAVVKADWLTLTPTLVNAEYWIQVPNELESKILCDNCVWAPRVLALLSLYKQLMD